MVVKLALVGYVITSQLIAHHPLHGMLAAYDREITALRSTQSLAGLRDPAGTTVNATAAVRVDASLAGAHADAIGSHDPAANRGRERAAATAVLRSEYASNRGYATYASQLAAETNANQRAYGGALTERITRAYDARAAQLRERESTLGFDLDRQNAGQRLMLRLKLVELHLPAARRAQLQAQLRALNASERQAVDTMRRRDAAELAAYRSQLESSAAAGAGAMDAQLRAKAGANYAIFQRVFNEGASAAGALPLPSQLAAFTNGYAAQRVAGGISSDMHAAAADSAQRFGRLSAVDVQSRSDVAAQLEELQAVRSALYHSMLAQIQDSAQAVARERHLASVKFVGAVPRGRFLDLTPTVALRVSHDMHS